MTDTAWGVAPQPTPPPTTPAPHPAAPPGRHRTDPEHRTAPKKRKPATRKPEQGLAAAHAFHQREGHLEVPQRHVEDLDGEPVRLGQWISNTRRRKERLPTDRIRALDALGMLW
ncbi:helicase associated domain-containing protein [Streptomyces microflavus]